MTEFLLRIFVKNYQDTSNPKVHSEIGKLAGVVGIVCNFLLSGGKLIAGIAVGSVSITADALNNLSDAVSSLITLVGFLIAQHPADKEHPYGHARFEYMSGMMVSVLILLMGIELVKSSVSKIFHPVGIKFEITALLILMISIGMKMWMYFFNRSLGKRIKSSTLFATATDSRNDVIATSAVLAGCIVHKIFGINVDGYIGLAVAIFILYSGIGIAKDTVTLLLGKEADEDLVRQINDIIMSHDKVLGFHDLLIHDYGPGKCYASVHVELSAEENALDCHNILDEMEREIAKQLNVQLVIHYDPVIINDSEWNQLKNRVTEILAEINQTFSMHDFRLVRDDIQTKILFDLVIPYSMDGQQQQLKEKIEEKLKNNDIYYPVVIRFEGK